MYKLPCADVDANVEATADVEAVVDEEEEVGTMVGMFSKVFENKEDHVGIYV